jgi:hypothetical protein
MIDTRERAYSTRLPQADNLLGSGQQDQLRAARDAADSRLNAIEIGNDVAALGTPQERDQWARVTHLEEIQASVPPGPERDESADKLRLIKGVLYWRLDASFKQRTYDQRRALHELDAQLEELQNRWVRIQRARDTVPANTGEFAARIAAMSDRVKSIRERLANSSEQQNHYLSVLAEEELQSQRDRLATYSLQARVQLADIYDRSSDQPAKPAESTAAPGSEPAPVQTPTPEPQPR